jgi:hypothetical protein
MLRLILKFGTEAAGFLYLKVSFTETGDIKGEEVYLHLPSPAYWAGYADQEGLPPLITVNTMHGDVYLRKEDRVLALWSNIRPAEDEGPGTGPALEYIGLDADYIPETDITDDLFNMLKEIESGEHKLHPDNYRS